MNYCVIAFICMWRRNVIMAQVITFGNFKGGVGKTTSSVMFAYILQEQGYKTLLVDLDPQANSTSFLANTFEVSLNNFVSIYEAMEMEDLSKAVLSMSANLDLLPSAVDLVKFGDLLNQKNKGHAGNKHYYFDYLLGELKDNYDFVIIDVPPTISENTNNALVASNYSLIIMQSEPDSLAGAIDFNDYIKGMKQFNPDLEVLGVLPYLVNKRSKIDEYILEKSLSEDLNIKDLVFKSHIYERERVKRFRINGITSSNNRDFHDKKTLKMYEKVVKEFLKRMDEK